MDDLHGEISVQYITWFAADLESQKMQRAQMQKCKKLIVRANADSTTLLPKTSTVENHSSAETKHFSTRSTRLGFSNAAATLSLSFNCLLVAASVE